MLLVASTATAFAPYVPTVKVKLVDGIFAGVEQTVKVQLLSMPLAWFIASFLAMSAIAHFRRRLAAAGALRGWLARGINPMRWIEYAFSSTVMIVAIAYISFIQDVPALVAIAAATSP